MAAGLCSLPTYFAQNAARYQAFRIAVEVYGDVFAEIVRGWGLSLSAV
jgi:hypothetical protein